MFDAGADPVKTPMAVGNLCFKGFAAGGSSADGSESGGNGIYGSSIRTRV